LETVYTINEVLISPATTNNSTTDSSIIFDNGERVETKSEKSKVTISESPSEEVEDPILHVIGDDFNDFV
jgi:hypothetical protein